MIEINNNTLFFNKREIKEYDSQISEALVFKNVIVVCLNYYEVTYNENIFGLSLNGDVLWQIQKYIPIEGSKSAFVGLTKENENLVWATNWDGTALLLNVKTGEIIKNEWHR